MAELTEESGRIIQEIAKLKKLWVKVLRSKNILNENQDVLKEFNVVIDPVEENSDGGTMCFPSNNLQNELQEKNFFIPYDQIIVVDGPQQRTFFNGLEVMLEKRLPLNP